MWNGGDFKSSPQTAGAEGFTRAVGTRYCCRPRTTESLGGLAARRPPPSGSPRLPLSSACCPRLPGAWTPPLASRPFYSQRVVDDEKFMGAEVCVGGGEAYLFVNNTNTTLLWDCVTPRNMLLMPPQHTAEHPPAAPSSVSSAGAGQVAILRTHEKIKQLAVR